MAAETWGRVAARWEEMCGVKRLAWLVPWHQEERKVPNLNLMNSTDLSLTDTGAGGELEFLMQPLARTSVSFVSYSLEVIKSQHFIFLRSTALWPPLINCSPSSSPTLPPSLHPASFHHPLWPLFHFSNIPNPLSPLSLSFLLSTIQSVSITTTTHHNNHVINSLDFLTCHRSLLWSSSGSCSHFWTTLKVRPKHSLVRILSHFSLGFFESRSDNAGEHVQT